MRNLHKVYAHETLDREDGGEVIRRVFKKEQSRFRVCSQVGLQVRDDEGGEEVGARERILGLLRERLGSEGLHCINEEIPVSVSTCTS